MGKGLAGRIIRLKDGRIVQLLPLTPEMKKGLKKATLKDRKAT